jgi:4-amino-4-deoxy-L-arabinose transferase-like glycosyltransferase
MFTTEVPARRRWTAGGQVLRPGKGSQLMPTTEGPAPRRRAAGAGGTAADVAGLFLLVFVGYFVRAGALPIRGEEPTRAQIAREMVERHDWLVPHIQGIPILSRPPLQNWVIAGTCLALGSWDEWAVRFPSVLATLLTTLLTYAYARTFLGRAGALAAAAAFATTADMFQMGRQAETEALFILLVSASLLTWHAGIVRRWPEALTWAAGYGLAALGMLTKGPQAPAYFVGSAGLYLVLTGEARRLWRPAHLSGILLAAAVVAAWVVPLSLAMGPGGLIRPWFGDPAMAPSWRPGDVAAHFLRFPFELAPGTLPWSLPLLLFLRRDFRRSVGAARPHVLFLFICLAVALPTCWLPASGAPRFFAPLFPCLAVLAGLAVERCAAAGPSSPPGAAWRRGLGAAAGVMAAAAVALPAAALAAQAHPALAPLAPPPLAALGYGAASAGLAALTWRARAGRGAAGVRLAVLGVAGFMVLMFAGVATDVRVRRSADAAAAVRRARDLLPPGQVLAGLGGPIDSLFPYYYGLPFITLRPWPAPGAYAGDDLTYFCFECPGDRRPPLPFAWEELAAVPLDRNRHPVPERVAVVGRRLPAAADAPAARAEPGAPAAGVVPRR